MRSLDTCDGLPPPYFIVQRRKKRRSRGEEIFLNKEELCQLQEINFAPLCRGNFFCSLPYFIRVSVWQNIWQFIYSICKVTSIGNIQLLLGPPEPNIHAGFQSFQSANTQNKSRSISVCLCLWFLKTSNQNLREKLPALLVFSRTTFSGCGSCLFAALSLQDDRPGNEIFPTNRHKQKTVPASSAKTVKTYFDFFSRLHATQLKAGRCR